MKVYLHLLLPWCFTCSVMYNKWGCTVAGNKQKWSKNYPIKLHIKLHSMNCMNCTVWITFTQIPNKAMKDIQVKSSEWFSFSFVVCAVVNVKQQKKKKIIHCSCRPIWGCCHFKTYARIQFNDIFVDQLFNFTLLSVFLWIPKRAFWHKCVFDRSSTISC